MKLIKTPLDPEEIKNLKVNEDFEITGKIKKQTSVYA